MRRAGRDSHRPFAGGRAASTSTGCTDLATNRARVGSGAGPCISPGAGLRRDVRIARVSVKVGRTPPCATRADRSALMFGPSRLPPPTAGSGSTTGHAIPAIPSMRPPACLPALRPQPHVSMRFRAYRPGAGSVESATAMRRSGSAERLGGARIATVAHEEYAHERGSTHGQPS